MSPARPLHVPLPSASSLCRHHSYLPNSSSQACRVTGPGGADVIGTTKPESDEDEEDEEAEDTKAAEAAAASAPKLPSKAALAFNPRTIKRPAPKPKVAPKPPTSSTSSSSSSLAAAASAAAPAGAGAGGKASSKPRPFTFVPCATVSLACFKLVASISGNRWSSRDGVLGTEGS